MMSHKSRTATLVLIMVLVIASETISVHPTSTAPTSSPNVNVSWSQLQRFTATQAYDFDPSIIETIDGTVWVFWEEAPYATPWFQAIHYKTYNWTTTTWSNEQSAESTSAQNVAPAAAQMANGTLYLSYSSNRTGNFQIFLKRYNPGSGWSQAYQLSSSANKDEVSSILAAKDGSLWVFWDRATSTNINLYYKVWRNGAWSSETALTTDGSPIRNQHPAAFQTQDGRIWLAWSQVQDANFNKVHIMYKIYNGVSWGSAVQVSSSTQDTHPTLMQDSNGTMWMAWSREISYSCTGGGCTQQDIIYISSTNFGTTWSSETNLTNDVNCVDPNCFDDDQPSMAEFKDGRVNLFWSTNRSPENWWDLYFVNSNPLPLHNVAVNGVTSGPLKVRAGGIVQVNVTVANLGSYVETFQTVVQATNKTVASVGTKTFTLSPTGSYTLIFLWNTAGVTPGKYSIAANIPPVTGEFFTGDNSKTGATVWVLSQGDVNMDGRVDILDAAAVANSFGTVPGMPLWSPQADLNQDGKIDILDASIVALWFGSFA